MSSGAAAAAVKLAIEPHRQVLANARPATSLQTEPIRPTASIVDTTSDPETTAVVHDSEIERIKAALEQRRKMFLVTAIEGARLARVEDSELYIEFAPADKHLRDSLAKSDNVKIIREACLEVTGKELGVRIVIKDESNNEGPLSRDEEERRAKQQMREQAESDPFIQEVLRTFRGEIVDVRRVQD